MSRKVIVRYVTLVFEAEDGNSIPSTKHLELQIYRAVDSVNNTNSAFSIADEDDRETKRSMFTKLGRPSQQFLEAVEQELGPDPTPVKTA